MHVRSFIVMFVTFTFLAGCGAGYLKDDAEPYTEQDGFKIDEEAEIRDTAEARQVIDVFLQYRNAMAAKDVGTIKRLISEDYYDNAGTTDTTRDDFGPEELDEIFELIANYADNVKYDVTLKALTIDGARASVDYEFDYAYHYTIGEKSNWDAGIEVNRLELEQQAGQWKIVSGL